MYNKWKVCKKILIIRPDNMGDILMSSPAIQALKKTFNCHITLLTSSMGKGITTFIPCIDEVMIYDLPWVKVSTIPNSQDFNDVIGKIISKKFDATVIFTVYSQNSLPSVMLAYLAGIPLRLAYCRENPYGLLTDWLPDKEPYFYILHQVKRDLKLVEFIGANIKNKNLVLQIKEDNWLPLQNKLNNIGVDLNKNWIIIHTGVSEEKRNYPKENWVQLAKKIIQELDYQVLFTGSLAETESTKYLTAQTGSGSFSLAGELNMEEFLMLIKKSPLVISVNTVTTHIAAATNTPVIVLYALTNPQHLPWKAKGKILPYQVSNNLKSKNEIIKFVTEYRHPTVPKMQQPNEVYKEVFKILKLNELDQIPEMLDLKSIQVEIDSTEGI